MTALLARLSLDMELLLDNMLPIDPLCISWPSAGGTTVKFLGLPVPVRECLRRT